MGKHAPRVMDLQLICCQGSEKSTQLETATPTYRHFTPIRMLFRSVITMLAHRRV